MVRRKATKDKGEILENQLFDNEQISCPSFPQ
jgi:hypothetical protein